MGAQEETRAVVTTSLEEVDDQEDDTVSLSDMPLLHNSTTDSSSKEETGSPVMEEFEFQTSSIFGQSKLDDNNMCAADEVFFQGRILPLRPSIVSFPTDRSRLHPRSSSSSSSYSSMSTTSLGFDSRSSSVSRSNSTGASISRSHSTESSGSRESSRASISSGNFYSYPSPKLYMLTRKASSHVPQRRRRRRRSTSSSSYHGAPSAGWDFFRLGLVRTREIELLRDIKQRKATAGSSVGGSKRYEAAEARSEKKAVEPSNRRCQSNRDTTTTSTGEKKRVESKIMKLLFGKRFGCKCSQGEAVEPVSSTLSSSSSAPNNMLRAKMGRPEDDGSVSRTRRRDKNVRCLSSRTFQWLEELSITKPY